MTYQKKKYECSRIMIFVCVLYRGGFDQYTNCKGWCVELVCLPTISFHVKKVKAKKYFVRNKILLLVVNR